LQSALALFAERGYEETSIKEIACQAGVAVVGFYQHFASKRQILLVLMDRLLQEASMLTLEARSADLSKNSRRAAVPYPFPWYLTLIMRL
jgi:AcrR family transcriptional regulator